MQVPLGTPSGKWLWQGYRAHRRDFPIHSGSLGRCVLFSVTMEEQPMRAEGRWSCGQGHPRPSPQVRILGGSHVLLLESRPFSDRSSIPKPQGPASPRGTSQGEKWWLCFQLSGSLYPRVRNKGL